MENIDDKNYETISPTAIVTSYPRTFTDIPYEKEIYNWLNKNCKEEVTLNKMLAPELEARYKLTNIILNKLNISQVLELASGYTSRGLIYSKKGYNYIEMDLENVSKNKIKILKSINNSIPDNLHIISGNALRKNNFDKCKKYLFELNDGNIVETVMMDYGDRITVCISNQVGCRMGCKFCASTLEGLIRNLEPWEILDQIIKVQEDTNKRVSNLVLMGSGEPLDNFENTKKFALNFEKLF